MRRIDVLEGQPFTVGLKVEPQLRSAMTRIQRQLRPRLPLLAEANGQFVVHNIIGTIRLNHQTVLEVVPKTAHGENWQAAVLDLVMEGDRIDFGGDRLGGRIPRPTRLLDVLAVVYAERLLLALRRDGPICMIERQSGAMDYIRGKLDLTQYLRDVLYRPHRFPVSFDGLTKDNDFARGMAIVARHLADATDSMVIRSLLTDLAESLGGYEAGDQRPIDALARREIPPQWAAYRPAWSIAVAVLSRISLLRPIGTDHRLEVAIEAWPLLERLLVRALRRIRSVEPRFQDYSYTSQVAIDLLKPLGSNGLASVVKPDGMLLSGSRTVATFEAKYAPAGSGTPERAHVFQAISTARAWKSPLAVLIYPERFDARWAQIQAPNLYPRYLVAIGLDLFSYRQGLGDQDRAERLANVLRGPDRLTRMAFA